jgi:hypothetical protein
MRSNRALWVWLGGLLLALAAFLVLVAIAYFEKVARYSLFLNGWMIVALVFFLAAFACFFAAIEELPVPLPSLLSRPNFPGIKIDIFGTGSMDTEREAGTGLVVPVRLRTFHARFANSDSSQSARLTVLLYVRLIPGSWGRAAEAVCPPLDWTLPPALNLSPLSMPFALAPGATLDGDLVYEVPAYYLDKIADPGSARLELWDQASGKRMSIQAGVGSYEKGDMTQSSGSAEELGPEYDAPVGLPGSAGRSGAAPPPAAPPPAAAASPPAAPPPAAAAPPPRPAEPSAAAAPPPAAPSSAGPAGPV